MFKRLQGLVLANFAVMLFFISSLGLDARSMWTLYEPDIPECLKER